MTTDPTPGSADLTLPDLNNPPGLEATRAKRLELLEAEADELNRRLGAHDEALGRAQVVDDQHSRRLDAVEQRVTRVEQGWRPGELTDPAVAVSSAATHDNGEENLRRCQAENDNLAAELAIRQRQYNEVIDELARVREEYAALVSDVQALAALHGPQAPEPTV